MNNCIRRTISGALAILLLFAGWCAFAISGAQAGVNAATTAPDLVIESVELSPRQPSIADTVTFSVTVKNQGDATAGLSQLTCYIDGTSLDSAPIESVDSGAITTRTFNWKAAAGPHIFRAFADSGRNITESAENNNEGTLAFSTLAPDLTIEAISWTPLNPSTGEIVTFTVNVTNRGEKRSGTSHLDFLIDGSSRGYQMIPGLEAGASVNQTFTWSAISGLHNVKAAADILCQVIESDETNNASEATCATALPDLAITSLILSPVNALPGDNVTLTGIIKNKGTGKAEPSRVSYYIDDVLQDFIVIGYLGSGNTTTVTFESVTKSDSRIFKLAADAGNEIQESDETNNTATVQSPLTLPDLIIQNITWSPAIPEINGLMYITIAVKNQGRWTAGNIEVKFGIDTIHHFNTSIAELGSGNTTTTTFMWTPIYPSFKVQASVDTSDKIKESNEANNTMTKTVTAVKFVPSADLAIETITCSPSSPVIGETVTVRLGVKNRGSGIAAPSYATVTLDGKAIEEIYIEELNGGAAAAKEIVIPLQGLTYKDAYHVEVTLDYYNSVPETDEANNRKETTFAVSAPDLVVKSIRWMPEVPAAGDMITFDLVVKNRGDFRAGVTYVSYYVDQVFMGQHRIEGLEPGATAARSFTWAAQKEAFQFAAFVDEAGDIREKDESNNVKMAVLPAPDLAIDAITWLPGTPAEFTPITFTADISNRGQGRSAVTALAWYFNNAGPLYLETGEISPGKTARVAFTYTFISGQHTLKLVCDANGAVTESDEANNEKTVVFYAQSIEREAPSSANSSTTNVTNAIIPVSTAAAKTNPPLKSAATTKAPQDISGNMTDSPPKWQSILQNKLLIIGLAVVGIGAIGVLLFLRRRAKKQEP